MNGVSTMHITTTITQLPHFDLTFSLSLSLFLSLGMYYVCMTSATYANIVIITIVRVKEDPIKDKLLF